ncbi:hypothetical protein PVAND_003362 [Polypedilum vanderplanki]|uniref:Uncharacterized protein n=1 Tax=Polypedilum vanderplanki TaxID=319348 RepID=A0A9J6BVK3_POLVA|nr:hypothetical protein PVAND_003362 [Polypedilum vanderplanki]
MSSATSISEDFVMTPIKCPPPKIVAVKRSLKSKRKRNMTKNIMDDEDDSDVKEDFINEDEFECDARDLIEFEKEEPLIDLSENSNNCDSRDTVKDMNAKNSNSSTITMLLDLLEIGSLVTGTGMSEIARKGSCAQENDCDILPSLSHKKVPSSPSSSLNELPLECPDACADVQIGKLELSPLPSLPQPLSAIQPENPSIVKNYSIWLEKSHEVDDKSCPKSPASESKSVESQLVAISTRQSSTSVLQKSSQLEQEEKSSSSIFTSNSKAASVDESSQVPTKCCSIKGCSCTRSDKNILTLESPPVSLKLNNEEDKNIYSVKDKEIVQETSDRNNNRESVCNQNFAETQNDQNYNFLSCNTSQREFPPKFFSSTSSLNQESCFEASKRLKRLEERFKGFSNSSKKLLRSSKVFSKSEEILSSCGKDTEFKSLYSATNVSDSLNSTSLLQFPLTTFSTFSKSEHCPQLADHDSLSKETEIVKNYNNFNAESNSLEEEIKRLPSLSTATLATLQRLQSPESSTESDEICKIFRDKDLINNSVSNNNKINSVSDSNNNNANSENCLEEEEGEDCSFVYYEEEPGSVSICEEEEDESALTGQGHSIFNDISFSNCEFDVQTFNKFLKEDEEGKCNSASNSEDDDDIKSDESDFFCDCLVEAVPLSYHQTSAKNTMRETGAGKLRGLLKPPNRPAPTRKNRVVFDETRNEFFEADYIILIREDCPYDEEDEEPCTCGDHELVRICCDEGCNCGYTDDDGRTPPSPKYAPPIEFVDQATLSPPEGYKDGSLLDSALSDALSNHVFGAQHIQQLQVIQRLQQQRAAMLAARAASTPSQQQQSSQQQQQQQQNIVIDPQQQGDICPECTQCSECAAAKLAELEAGECDSQCSEQESPMETVTTVPPQPHVLNVIGSLVPVSKSSPERRNQKEIVAGEERPKFLTTTKTEDSQAVCIPETNETSYVVETITTTTTVTEHTIIRTAAEDSDQPPPKPPKAVTLQPPALPEGRSSIYASSQSVENMKNDLNATIIPKFNVNGTSTAQAITGILKGGKLRKTDSIQNDETNNTTSDEETSSKRSVRFNEESGAEDGELQNLQGSATDEDGKPKNESQLTDYVTHMSLKRHSSLFHNALRPNSAVRQLFPAKSPPSALTHEALKAFEESKRSGNLLTASQAITSGGSASSSSTSPTPMSSSDTDTIKRTIERNALRRSLIKYEPKKKVVAKDSTSLEERIRQLTCDIDEPIDSDGNSSHNANDMERRDSPAGEETPQQTKFDKSFSPSSSASSSSSCSTGSTYKKITDLFNKEKRHEKIPETDENPIVIQDCRCGPDLGMGVQIQHAGHSHSHQHNHPPPPPPRSETTKRQFLNTLAPLTACVAGQRDDNFSYYIASKPGDRTSTASSQTGDQYSIGDIDAALQDGNNDGKKVAPDVIAGTPMNNVPGEQDELVSFAQQEANRMDRIKKRYSSDSAPASGVNSDDDEQNDYGFNKRPSVRGIKARFGSTNEILQQMQDQLSQPNVPTVNNNNPTVGNNNNTKSNNMQSATLPRTNAAGQLQIANSNQQQQQTNQQNTGTWTYYPDQQGKNYYHLPAHARHSYHGEAIYQNCHTMTVQQTQQAIINPGHVHQKLAQQPHAAAIHAIQHAQQINRFSHFARSPTRRPESPPPLRNYHQTMVLIPYKAANGNGTYTTYGIATEGGENIYQRQQHIEYQQVNECKSMVSNPELQIFDEMQVTQQTIRIPVGYPIPGMQLHVVNAATQRSTPHYATLPRQNSAQGANPTTVGNAFIYPDKPMESRGVPEGEAATVQQTDCTNNIITTCQDGESNNNPPGTVYYAMNV